MIGHYIAHTYCGVWECTAGDCSTEDRSVLYAHLSNMWKIQQQIEKPNEGVVFGKGRNKTGQHRYEAKQFPTTS